MEKRHEFCGSVDSLLCADCGDTVDARVHNVRSSSELPQELPKEMENPPIPTETPKPQLEVWIEHWEREGRQVKFNWLVIHIDGKSAKLFLTSGDLDKLQALGLDFRQV